MPFGLTNAPATFERLMENVLEDLQGETCLVYLDDVIVYGKTFEQELERLEAIMERLEEANLKLNPKKCHLFQNEINYLGHIVSSDGIMTDPTKVEAVKNWPTPTTKR